ncbi:hypothetical protein ACLKA6_016335 [Drosophila palustris]
MTLVTKASQRTRSCGSETLFGGDTAHQTNQQQQQQQEPSQSQSQSQAINQSQTTSKQQIFIHSRSYGPKSSSSNTNNNTNNNNSNSNSNSKKMQHGNRKSGNGMSNHGQHQNYHHQHHHQNHYQNNHHTHHLNFNLNNNNNSNNYTNGQGQGQGQGYGHGDSLSANHQNNGRSINGIFYRHCSDCQPGAHGNFNLNAAASVYNIRAWSGWEREREQHEMELEQVEKQQQQQVEEQEMDMDMEMGEEQESETLDASSSHFEKMQPLQTSRSHQLNVSAPSFTPASARGGNAMSNAAPVRRHNDRQLNHHHQQQQHHSQHSHHHSQHSHHQHQHHQHHHPIIPSQSQPQLHSTVRNLNQHQNGQQQQRRQQLPDLFQTVLKLMRELNRSVSYPEMIGMLSMRLQRLPVELKRHIPHTLHGAVANGYLRKDGNYYTLLSEQEQKEIMKRNQEAAKRAKELEKEPLSWRIR